MPAALGLSGRRAAPPPAAAAARPWPSVALGVPARQPHRTRSRLQPASSQPAPGTRLVQPAAATRLRHPLVSQRPVRRSLHRHGITCQAAAATGAAGSSDGSSPAPPEPHPLLTEAVRFAKRVAKRGLTLLRAWTDHPSVKLAGQYIQFTLAIVFVALYVYATYVPPAPDSVRASIDIWLCAIFALEYVHRLVTADSKLRMLTSFWNVCDLLSFAPPLLELLLRSSGTAFSLGGIDLRWTKILRSMRVLRVGLLSSELRSLHLSTRRGGWLSAGTNFRLFQLLNSVLILLFTTSAVIQVVERMPFHQALYLVVTTLTTVGFGDVVAQSILGKAVVITTICFGVVAIPVQAAQLYAEFNARRVVRGSMPSGDRRAPMVLLSTRLTEVRAFSDFYSEFQQALVHSSLIPPNTKMLVLCNRPSYEFGAFQELHEKRITFMEGSAVSGQDLVAARAERARACLLLADRFTTDPEQEDLSILFQVWAMKSYTKTVPLYVQTVRESTVGQISPFLDPGQDVIVSMEQTRMRLLALSAVCPGASTLIGNLIKSSSVRPLQSGQRTLAGREWLRAYVNGCAYQFIQLPVPEHLAGRRFMDIAQWLFWSSGKVLIGLIDEHYRLMVNPADMALPAGATLVMLGTSKRAVGKALKRRFSRLRESELVRLRYLPQELAREAAEREAAAQEACPEGWLMDSFEEGGEEAWEVGGGSSRRESEGGGINGINGGGGIASSSSSSSGGGSGGGISSVSGGSVGAGPAAADGAAASAAAAASAQQQRPCSVLTEAEEDDIEAEFDAECCVPLLVGNPDSESLDADSVPCVPPSTARRLTTPAAVKAFVQAYQQSPEAQQEQLERGALRASTADKMVMQATAAAAKAAAARQVLLVGEGSAGGVQRSSVDFGGGAVDWESEGRGSTLGSFAAGSRAGSGSRGGGAIEGDSMDGSLDDFTTTVEEAIASMNGSVAAAKVPKQQQPPPPPRPDQLTGHFIVCGAEESFGSFIDNLRKCGPRETPIVVLHPTRPDVVCDDGNARMGYSGYSGFGVYSGGGGGSTAGTSNGGRSNGSRGGSNSSRSGTAGGDGGGGGSRGPVYYVEGSASEAASLRLAGASTARALIYLAKAARPVRSAQGTGGAVEKERSTREAVLADAQALLAVYGVGEESGAELTHAVVELLFTTSIEFLQPGLLLKGVNLLYDDSNIPAGQPRKSWVMRSWQQREAVSDGLAEWQANPYFAAGRVTVPALLDTFACQSFFNEGVLIDLLGELSGGDSQAGCEPGAALQQVPVPPGLAGRPYGELFMHLALSQRLICLGLYRRKSENPGTRLSYVVASPAWGQLLEATDRVFVLRPRQAG